ncbi:MAG: hypothetical protein HYR56_10840 [Acidobacteria bacterium]|nr:hypothetical protein [Acidobacteriota bacterium]MBI3424951.1 hypothetical protein [Acidobacteriota bacterium]
MAKINVGRVILGGLVAGVVLNIGEAILNLKVLGTVLEEFNKKFNLPAPSGGFIATMTVLMFVFGIVLVFVYAAIRPRFGAGVKTAVIAALLVWFLSFFYSAFLNTALGLFGTGPSVVAMSWELAEAVLASLAGAWVYQESA